MTVIDTGSLTLVARVNTLGMYDNAGLGTWNGQPLSPTNQPSPEEDQLSATWNFYVDPLARNTLYVVVSDVFDTRYGFISGSPFNLVALTGFQFSVHIPTPSYASFSNQFAVSGEVLLGPTSSSSVPLSTTPGWNLLTASGASTDAIYKIGTPTVSDAFTHFGSVSGDTRIFGGGVFQFTFDSTVNLLAVDFSTLHATASNGEGAYIEQGTTTVIGSSHPIDQIPHTPATTFPLLPGQPIQGHIDASDLDNTAPDSDWYRLSLVGGHTYYFTIEGTTLNAVAADIRDQGGLLQTPIYDTSTGAVALGVGIRCGVISSDMKLSVQAARSIG